MSGFGNSNRGIWKNLAAELISSAEDLGEERIKDERLEKLGEALTLIYMMAKSEGVSENQLQRIRRAQEEREERYRELLSDA